MKEIYELELSEKSFFDKEYILRQIELGSNIRTDIPISYFKSSGIRFLEIAEFPDARIIKAEKTERYGKDCIVLQVNFRGTFTPLKAGYRKFEIYFLNAGIDEEPISWQDVYIYSLECSSYNCAETPQKLAVKMELTYFYKEQKHECVTTILCSGVEVKPYYK